MKKWICILTVLCLLAALASCGEKQSPANPEPAQTAPADPAEPAEKPAPEPAAEPAETPEEPEAGNETPSETQSGAAETAAWGDWSVAVPADFEFRGGDFWDEEDPRYFSVKKGELYYFDFKADDEKTIMNQYNYNKNTYTNEQKDVSGSYGGIDWTGFEYSDGYGGSGFEAYAMVGGKLIRVSSAGFPFDSEPAKTVLGSLTYAGSEEPAADPALFWARFRGDWHGMMGFRECTGKYEYLQNEEVTAIVRFKVFESGAINPFVGVHVEDTPFEHLYAEFAPDKDCILLKGQWIHAEFADVEVREENGLLSFTVPISKDTGSLEMVFNLRRLDDTGWSDEDPRLDEETVEHCVGMSFDDLAKLNGYSFADYPSEDKP